MRRAAIIALVVLTGCPSKKDRVRQFEAHYTKFREYVDRTCACKDKACADQVQEAMTKWSTDVAKESDRDFKLTDEQMKKMSDVATLYSECMTKLMTSGAVATPHPEVPSPSNGDADALLRAATEWVRAERPQHLLADVTLWYVDEHGMLDDKHGRFYAAYGRTTLGGDDPTRKTGAPITDATTYNDCFGLSWNHDSGWENVPAPCTQAVEAGIQCSVREIWKRAIATEVPADALATIALKPTAESRMWGFWITDEPRDVHINRSIADDCPLAVEK